VITIDINKIDDTCHLIGGFLLKYLLKKRIKIEIIDWPSKDHLLASMLEGVAS